MSKKKITYRRNRIFNSPAYYYSWGGDFKNSFNNAFSGSNIGSGLASGIGGIGQAFGQTISGNLNSGAGNAISNIGGTIGKAIPGPVGGAITGITGLVGGLINRMFGSKLNKENIAKVEKENKTVSNVMVDNSSNESILNQWGKQNFGSEFTQEDIGEDGWFSNKAKDKYEELLREQAQAENRALTAYEDAVRSADTQSDLNLLAQSFADGGKIYIKPSKRGTFTAAAKKRGMGVQEFASKVLANKDDYSPAMVKKANFARNASKWHSLGGPLQAYGTDWDNGVTIIGNGGTHEENPMEGVQIGVDPEGIPNLVEEGEVIFDDYVFSNRLTVPKAVRKKYKLRGNKDITFADAAKQMQKESEERPNDPISKRGLEDSMMRLMASQEEIRNTRGVNNKNVFAGGGPAGINPDLLEEDTEIDTEIDTVDPFFNPNIVDDTNDDTNYNTDDVGKASETRNRKNNWASYLRYVPVLGSAVGAAYNLFSSPDYSSSDAILNAANNLGNYTPISFDPIGNYLTYTPFDRNFYINKLNAQAGATRRAIMNTSNPSRNAALLAADYNAQGRLGDLARQAEEYNLAQRQQVENFNRATNMANSEMGLKASIANQEAALKAKSARLNGIIKAIEMRDTLDQSRAMGRSTNLTNLFEGLGDIGREAVTSKMILSNPALYYSIDLGTGAITYKNGYDSLSDAAKDEVNRHAAKATGKAFGGYLTIKKRRK